MMTDSLLVNWIILAVVCGIIATFFCGRAPLVGFLLGGLFGPIGFILAAQVNTQMAIAELRTEMLKQSIQP